MEQAVKGRLPAACNVSRTVLSASTISDAAIDRAIELVASGHSITDAVENVGISRSTLWYRASKDPRVAMRLEQAKVSQRQAIADEVIEKAQLLTGEIVYQPELGADGEVLVDENFDAIMQKRLVNYDPQILGRLVNKMLPGADGPQVALQINNHGPVMDKKIIDVDAVLATIDAEDPLDV